MLVVSTMFARPKQYRILESASAKDHNEKAERKSGAKGKMRKEPVITERDAESGGNQKREEDRDLKPVDTEVPNIKRHGGQGEEESADKERTSRPVNALERNTGKHGKTAEMRGKSELDDNRY